MMKKFFVLFLVGQLTMNAQTEAGVSANLLKEKGTILFQVGESFNKYSSSLEQITTDKLPDFVQKLDHYSYYIAKPAKLSSDKLFGYPVQKIIFSVADYIATMHIILKKVDAEKLRTVMINKYGDPEYILDPITGEPAPRYTWWSTDFNVSLAFYFGPNFETGEGEGAYMAVFSMPGI